MKEIDHWINEVFRAATLDAAARGFRCADLVAKRRNGRTQQIIAFMPLKRALGTRWEEDFGHFSVRVVITFDGVDPGWEVGLEALVPDLPGRHELRRSRDLTELARSLRTALISALDLFDHIDGAETALSTFEERGWFLSVPSVRVPPLRGALRAAAGDVAGAQADFDDDDFDILTKPDDTAE